MKIGPNTTVKMDYSLFLKSGEMVASTEGKEPIEFKFGQGELLEALERKIEGMEPKEEKEIVLTPEEGFGNINHEAILEIPKNNFPEDVELKEGMTFRLQRDDGQIVPFIIRRVKDDLVTIDFNHPLAGETLRFVVIIREVNPIS
ncbi:MAG: peptidylprolyl isomerase [Candidatus Aminicenantia bacterium]